MFLNLILAFFSLIGLIILHELGHFVFAKKFGVKVEEFGIGYPPRLLSKKIGETVYSLNVLPFGAFVKILGEEKRTTDPRSFSAQPIKKRVWIVLGGVLSFWVISAILLSIVMVIGQPVMVGDEESGVLNPRVQIIGVAPGSPAEETGLKMGDTIEEVLVNNSSVPIFKIFEFQKIVENYKGREIVLKIKRGKETFETKIVPRLSPPENEGPIGITLARVGIKKWPWYQAPWQGIKATINLTLGIIQGLGYAVFRAIKGLPTQAQLIGPVGIFALFSQMTKLGTVYFIQMIVLVSLHLAIFNLLPIPVFDGGKLLFLGIEAIRKKPVSERVERNLSAFFFVLLIILMIVVVIKDINRFF